MKRTSSFLVVTVVAAGIASVVACSGDDDTPQPSSNPADGGGDAQPVVVTPPADSGTPIDSGTPADSGAPETGTGTCQQIGGVYALTSGSCTSSAYSPPKVFCIRQKGCNLTGTDDFLGQAFTGSIDAAGDLTATTTNPVHEDCRGSAANGVPTSFSCNAAGITCSATPTKVTLSPDVTDTCCDVKAQDCGDGQRCVPVGSSNTALAYVNACLPDNGTVALGGSCMRKSTANVDVGNDNCKKGLLCANIGQATPTTRTCQTLCTDNAECTVAGDECVSFFAATTGLCTPRCSVFGGTGATCGTGQTCRVGSSLSGGKFLLDQSCGFAGAGVVGATCTFLSDCGAGLTCSSAGKCAAYCDSANACTTGTCTTITGIAVTGYDASLGVCL